MDSVEYNLTVGLCLNFDAKIIVRPLESIMDCHP